MKTFVCQEDVKREIHLSVDAFGAAQSEVLLRIEHGRGAGEKVVLTAPLAKELGSALIAEAAKSEEAAGRDEEIPF